jgi:hypothetical protein
MIDKPLRARLIDVALHGVRTLKARAEQREAERVARVKGARKLAARVEVAKARGRWE